MQAGIEEKVMTSVCCRALIPAHAPVLLMVSGGSDSVALIYLIRALQNQFEFGTVQVLHVNHHLRGSDADADERFVVELAQLLGLPCEVRHVDVAKLCLEEHGNAEHIGRRERYRLAHEMLKDLCKQQGVDEDAGRIITAHTADDRVETFIMRSIMGAGPGGLASIPWQAGCVARPLLNLTRAELRDYLTEQLPENLVPSFPGERWREDATNDDVRRFRAFVRKRIVPEGLVFNPAFKQNLCRTMDLIAEEDAMLREMTDKVVATIVSHRYDGSVSIVRSALLELPRPMERRVLRAVIIPMLGDDARLDDAHIERIIDGAIGTGFSLCLPQDITVIGTQDELLVLPAALQEHKVCAQGWLSIPGSFDCGAAGTLHAKVVTEETPIICAKNADAVVVDVGDARRVWVRATRTGDRMQPFGLGGHSKKLSDLFVDEKIPRHRRASIPLVCASADSNAAIVWCAGMRLDERFRITPHTVRRVQLVLDSNIPEA